MFEIAGRGEPFEPLAILYFLVQAPEQVLVIGAGGGKDVVTARAYGAKGINGVIQIISKKAGRDTERP